MNKLVLFLLLACSSHFVNGQDTTVVYFDSEWNECDKGEHAYYGKTFQINDSLWGQLDFYASGAPQMIGSYEEEEKETRSGEFIYFTEEGDTTGIYGYKKDEKEGRYITFFENGNREIVTRLENGLQNGPTVYYHENGAISSKGEFKKGSRFGKWDYYDVEGEFIASEYFVREYKAPCGYKVEIPERWIMTTFEDYGKVHKGVSLDRLFRKGVYNKKGEAQFFSLDAICLNRPNLSAYDVCRNMASGIDKAKMKTISDYEGMTFKKGEFYTYKKKTDDGKKLVVLLFAHKHGEDIAQLKFSFEPKVEEEVIAEIFEIVNSLDWD
ncbi:hypothetical protein GYB22_04840 [bacterium]|nr:hypothetical protein [bacterium]